MRHEEINRTAQTALNTQRTGCSGGRLATQQQVVGSAVCEKTLRPHTIVAVHTICDDWHLTNLTIVGIQHAQASLISVLRWDAT